MTDEQEAYRENSFRQFCVLAGVVGEPRGRTQIVSPLDVLFLLFFFPQLSPVYSRGYDLYEREQFLERSTLPSKMNSFHRLYHVLAILTSDA